MVVFDKKDIATVRLSCLFVNNLINTIRYLF